MLVSIIIPVHKTISFFKDCVLSALNQSYKNLEVIIACNGALKPKDCQKFLEINDKRLIFIESKSGRHHARNKALKVAKGNYIQFLDYDDYLFKDKIAVQLSALNNATGLNICVTKWKKFNKTINEFYNFPFKDLFENNNLSTQFLIEKLGKSKGFIATSSWLVPTHLCKQILWVDSPNDDAVYLSEFFKKNVSFIMVSETLAGYRIHDNNTSSIRTKAEFDKLLSSWKIIRSNLKAYNTRHKSLYLYRAHLSLITYSKQIKRYKLIKVIMLSISYGVKSQQYKTLIKDLIK